MDVDFFVSVLDIFQDAWLLTLEAGTEGAVVVRQIMEYRSPPSQVCLGLGGAKCVS